MEITTENILSELNKPLETANSVLFGERLAERLGVPKDHMADKWLFFYRELYLCIKEGLVDFINDWDREEFYSKSQSEFDKNFYMNYVQNKPIRITTNGKAWLAQHQVPHKIKELNVSVEALKDSDEGKLNEVIKSIEKLDKRNLIIGISIIGIGILTLVVAFLRL
jgi:hypothetical protein